MGGLILFLREFLLAFVRAVVRGIFRPESFVKWID